MYEAQNCARARVCVCGKGLGWCVLVQAQERKKEGGNEGREQGGARKRKKRRRRRKGVERNEGLG